MLTEAVTRFVAQRCAPTVARNYLNAAAPEQTDETEPTGRTHRTGAATLPPFWEELTELGWLVPHAHGSGIPELVVVLEGLGGAVAPGPALATSWATAVLATAGDGAARALAQRLAGGAIGTVARNGAVTVSGDTLSGSAGIVLCGALADVVVLPALDEGGRERWFALEPAAVRAGAIASAPQTALDPTQPLATVELSGARATELPGLERPAVETLGVTLAAAVATGGAQWCVETAAGHATQRHQFGRPIGQFQAVKHRCADMLVRLEEARAVTWDAARALGRDAPADGPTVLATLAAGAIAFDAFVGIAEDCIQVLGGIGFTWEHDAHLYLRRAVALRQLFGAPSAWRAGIARSALDGARRRLVVDLPPRAEERRAGIRGEIERIAALPREAQRGALADAGMIAPHWPAPWGRDADAVEQLVIEAELRRLHVRVPHLQVGAWAAPTILAHGTAEQQKRWVGPTLRGEITWCQLFSEPGAGSDLAALSTTATRTEGGWLLQGQKVWTTLAAEADWGICLARTDRGAPKHQGITYFVVDMSAEGFDVRPLREITGLAMFNEVFLDGVFVPDDAVIGEVNGGWELARTTLANERVSMGSGSSFGGGVETLVSMVGERIGDGRLDGDALLLDRLGGIVAEAHCLAVMGLRATLRSVDGTEPGPEASVRKLAGAEHDQRTQELGLTLLGEDAAVDRDAAAQWIFGFLANRCLTIAGGTSEIQRNVIGERLLGLPRDAEPQS